MKICILFLGIIILSVKTYSQEIKWFGPIAGIGVLPNSGSSAMKSGFHSAFGWHVELPYTDGDLTGYGEAGLTIIGIEQGRTFGSMWGYFGCRYKEIGGGIGPVYNPVGTGLGMNIYYNIYLEKLRIPIGFDWNFVNGTTRVILFISFNYK